MPNPSQPTPEDIAKLKYAAQRPMFSDVNAMLTNEEAARILSALREGQPDVDTCEGCGAARIAAITAVIQGKIACCPDCSTLTMGERNTIREALATLTAPQGRGEGSAGYTHSFRTSELPERSFVDDDIGFIEASARETFRRLDQEESDAALRPAPSSEPTK
jgi:hypothetical protein